MPFTSVTPFVIRELTGDERVLTLIDRALPFRPFELTGTQRVQTTWYPGSPIATLQVLGAAESETTINGMWHNRYLGLPADSSAPPAEMDGMPLTNVQTLAAAVDDFRRKGQLVEVTWLNHVRQGIISQFRQSWEYPEDVEWELTFVWISQGEFELDLGLEPLLDVSDVPDKVDSLVTKIVDTLNAVRAEVTSLEQDIEQRLLSSSDAAKEVVAKSIELLVSPVEAAQRIAGVLNGIKDDASLMKDQFDVAAATVLNAGLNLGDEIRQLQNVRDGSSASRTAARFAAREISSIGSRLNPEIVGTFFATEGQDLRDISTQFYGTPNEWRSLKIFNSFDSSKLAAGQLVLVPATPQQNEPNVC